MTDASPEPVFDRAAIGQLVAVFVVGLVLLGTLAYTAWLPGTEGPGLNAGDLWTSIAVGVIFGVAGIGTLLRVWARSGGRRLVVRMDAALDAGSAPADADPLEWVPALQRWRQSLLVARWVAPALAAIFVLTTIPRLVAGTVVVLVVLTLVVAVVGVVAAVAVIARSQRRVPAVNALVVDLEARQQAIDDRVADGPGVE